MTSFQHSQPARSISVLLPTLNGEALLGDVLGALSAQRVSTRWDCVVVDSGYDRTLSKALYNCPDCYEEKLRSRKSEAQSGKP